MFETGIFFKGLMVCVCAIDLLAVDNNKIGGNEGEKTRRRAVDVPSYASGISQRAN